MPVKFWHTRLRFCFFLSYLITTVLYKILINYFWLELIWVVEFDIWLKWIIGNNSTVICFCLQEKFICNLQEFRSGKKKITGSRNSDPNFVLKANLLITLFDFWGIITKVEANRQFFMHIIMTVRVLNRSMWALQPMHELIRNTLVVKTNYQQHSMLG